jgi:disease resistance protein RPM1
MYSFYLFYISFLCRYLLLIDDVWSSSTWQNIKKCFPENEEGSRIIVTTRFQAVAVTCSSRKGHDHIHPIEVLPGDEPKKLFHKTLLEHRGTGGGSQPNLNKIPPRVWEICGRSPLAIVTMAGLAASKPLMSQNDWLNLCKSLFPEPERCRKPEDFMRIINYCYNDMPSDNKICPLYLSIFPKGRKVSRKRLIRRWIAEGYVREARFEC